VVYVVVVVVVVVVTPVFKKTCAATQKT